MAKPLFTDELWEVIEPLLPEEPPKPNGGRPRIDDRAALTGILFVLKSGIPWEMLPLERHTMGDAAPGDGLRLGNDLLAAPQGVARWAGVWERLHRRLLGRLGEADQIDWERASLDSASVHPPPGGQRTGPNPTEIREQIRERRARSAILW